MRAATRVRDHTTSASEALCAPEAGVAFDSRYPGSKSWATRSREERGGEETVWGEENAENGDNDETSHMRHWTQIQQASIPWKTVACLAILSRTTWPTSRITLRAGIHNCNVAMAKFRFLDGGRTIHRHPTTTVRVKSTTRPIGNGN